MPNAVEKALPIELDCTMLPIKPSAQMIATEKKAASALPSHFTRPPKAARM